MVYNEKEVRDLCKKYDIEVEESNGYPLFNGVEMNPETFSFSDNMNEPVMITEEGEIIKN